MKCNFILTPWNAIDQKLKSQAKWQNPKMKLRSAHVVDKREREIKFIGLFGDRGHRGPYSPYKPCNHNLYIGIIIFPHIDNPQSTGYD